LENRFLNPHTVLGRIAEATAHGMRRPTTHGRPKGWLGLGLAARSCGEMARGAVRSACDGAVACSSTTRWRLAGSKVLPVSLQGPQGGRWARWSGVELTRAAARHGGGGVFFGRRRSSVGRELRWRWRHGPALSARKRGWEGLTVKRQGRWRSDGNQRGGGGLQWRELARWARRRWRRRGA
jgi:hypothetical protein